MQEIWKPIEGYEGLYEISNLGQVRSLNYNKTGEVQVLTPTPNKKGYLQVTLYKNGKRKKFLIHRLVATAFLPNQQDLETVNHKNFDKQDNRVDNLEWLSKEDNIKHSWISNKEQADIHRYNMREAHKKKIQCVETGEMFESITEANDWLGVKHYSSCIWNCLSGKQKTAYGYHWRYIEEKEREQVK